MRACVRTPQRCTGWQQGAGDNAACSCVRRIVMLLLLLLLCYYCTFVKTTPPPPKKGGCEKKQKTALEWLCGNNTLWSVEEAR